MPLHPTSVASLQSRMVLPLWCQLTQHVMGKKPLNVCSSSSSSSSSSKRGRLYSSFVQSSMLHGSETWPVSKGNEVALQRAEMRMVRWMCDIKVKDELQELKDRLGIDDIISVLQQNRLRWYRHVSWKEDNDWVKKCTKHEVEDSTPRGRLKKTWTEIMQKDCEARKLNREYAMDRSRWRRMIKDG